ncbi:MAG: hypothetical protein R3E95_09890 [Thiolinea sp.]
MFLDDALHNGQAQTSALADLFGGEEGSKIRDRSASAMPLPLSLTSTSTPSITGRLTMVTRPLASVVA